MTTSMITALMLLLGGIPGYYLYIARRVDPKAIVDKYGLKPLYNFLWNRWYINPTYYKVLVYGVIDFSRALFKHFEVKVVDGFNYALAKATVAFSNGFRRIQTGILPYNMLGIAIGILLLAALILLGI